MLVSIIKRDNIRRIILPKEIYGSYWISDVDENGNESNLISIEASSEGWKLISNKDVYCVEDNMRKPFFILEDYRFYDIKNAVSKNVLKIYCSPLYDESYVAYDLSIYQTKDILVGKAVQCGIIYKSSDVNDVEFKLIYSNHSLFIQPNLNSLNSTYLNRIRLTHDSVVKNGDVIFVMGLKIIYFIFDRIPTLIINNVIGNVVVNLEKKIDLGGINNPYQEDEFGNVNVNVYDDSDYFHKKPRFTQEIREYELSIDPPPSKREENKTPLLLTIGPMFTTSMIAVMYGFNAYNTINSNNGSVSSAIPQIVMCVSMLAGTVLWPIVSKRYNKKKSLEFEKARQEKYQKYLNDNREKILVELNNQRNILINNNPSLLECVKTIEKQNMSFWQRRVEDNDFLSVNLGIGQVPMKINIKYPEEHFTMDEDSLRQMSFDLGREEKILEDVPITMSFRDKNVVAIIGSRDDSVNYMQRLLVQLVAYHSYDNLKIVILTDGDNSERWSVFKMLPHCWNNQRSFRYFGTCSDEYKDVCYNLDGIFSKRLEGDNKNVLYNPYYLVVTDCFKAIRNYEVIKQIFENKNNYGFNMVILNDQISNLPDQCQTFINLNNNEAELFETVLNDKSKKMKIDLSSSVDIAKCVSILANIPIEFSDNQTGNMPDVVSFLEMYGVGKIEQLNVSSRWANSNPMTSLRASVGIGKSGEKISIDLHEKYHGPHGLVAGMTGSGKSEFLITYILSMAVNYHPYEVQFILIDYKGGGLAGAFENSMTGVKLPHLVGVITNLDANEIKRSLSSIESELKRRQRAFNKAREISGESTIDIYKYQKMYREHIVDEPISHLFVISDEFAELKNQEPEFMDELISTARIGRSLGIHLILATQKPSGVVNAQIWSNTRFRVCLRVQDKSDSTEVIKCPDAAYLKQTGRFYFQVGTNEIFTLGQSAYCGMPYVPSETIKREVDTSIDFINNNGQAFKSVNAKHQEVQQVVNRGEELTNIVNYLSFVASSQNIVTKPLWLPKISEVIYIEDIKKKYNYVPSKYVFTPVIGLFDDPTNQRQGLAVVDITNGGNTLIYGMAGSGEDLIINTLIYSLVMEHTPSEVNIYGVDCGSETMNIFRDFPQVGDIALINDQEKIANLFKMLSEEVVRRKKLFVEYNGDYDYYSSHSSNKVPAIVMIISNYDAFKESYSSLEDVLRSLTRECSKYGIYVVLSVSSTTGIRSTLKQNFNNILSLQLADASSYNYVFGNIHKLAPSKLYGRGLIKMDNVYEFQTAHICDDQKLVAFVKELAVKLRGVYSLVAPRIPILPDVVDEVVLGIDGNTSLNAFPVGISKDSLEIVRYNFMQDEAQLLLTLYEEDVSGIINSFVKLFSKFVKVLVVDSEKIISSSNNYVLLNDNSDKVMEQILGLRDGVDKYLCIIVGLDKFVKGLSLDNKKKIDKLFSLSDNIVGYVIAGTPDMVKPLEYEVWYKKHINNKQGIWIGNGIADQSVMKVDNTYKLSKLKLSNNFGFVIKKGVAVLTKMVE